MNRAQTHIAALTLVIFLSAIAVAAMIIGNEEEFFGPFKITVSEKELVLTPTNPDLEYYVAFTTSNVTWNDRITKADIEYSTVWAYDSREIIEFGNQNKTINKNGFELKMSLNPNDYDATIKIQATKDSALAHCKIEYEDWDNKKSVPNVSERFIGPIKITII